MHYRIQARLDEKADILTGRESLTYWNNSPDTLTELFFHVYQNAFTKGSEYDKIEQDHDTHHHFGPYESQGLGTEVLSMKVNGSAIEYQLNNTVIKVPLKSPIAPGGLALVDIEFRTYFDSQGSMGRRMKKFTHAGQGHYDGVHWYPRISVYDRKFGWTTDQHLGHEFYGDFGTFDVELTMASNLIMDATGFMLNRDEVLPPDLRRKLDVANFKDKPWNEQPSVIIPYDSTSTRTWRFHAENVHDFAWTADPTYRIGEADAVLKNDGDRVVKCYSLVMEEHACEWQNAASFSAKVIELFSERIGTYGYHKMIVADARDGMEYPMLTLDGDSDPFYKDLLVHEIGHNWFYGMVGNNETYRAALDEGFTQYLTAMGMIELEGDTDVFVPSSHFYQRWFEKPVNTLDNQLYHGFMRSGRNREVPAINVHSDHYAFDDYRNGYGHVYYKTGVMLYNLEYVLGNELYAEVIKQYFEDWKFAHPYWDDFRKTVRKVTKSDMNWFFDQWVEGTGHIDYAIRSVNHLGDDRYRIKLKRKDDMQMPLDIRIHSREGGPIDVLIPNTYFVKKTTAKVLPQWTGWGKYNRKYEFDIEVPGGIRSIQIDTSRRLADVYQLDNLKGPSKVKFEFDSQLKNKSERDKYEFRIRPDFWYNAYDGIKAGGAFSGDYYNTHHVFDVHFWVNSGVGQWGLPGDVSGTDNQFMSFIANYKTSLGRFWKRGDMVLGGRVLDGLYHYDIGVRKVNKRRTTTFDLYFRSLYRNDRSDIAYLLERTAWNPGMFNNTINASVEHNYEYKGGKGTLRAAVKGTGPGSDYGYANLQLEAVDELELWRLKLKTRWFAQIGTDANVAPESALYLDRASPEEMLFNKYTRSAGFFPSEWATYGSVPSHFHYGGGLNLRGYASYVAPQLDENGNVVLTYVGNTGAAINVELEFDEIFGFKPGFTKEWLDIDLYAFADLGIINLQGQGAFTFAEPRMDAGVGASLTIKDWGVLEKAKPLTIRFDVPFFLSHAPALKPQNIQFNWLIGIGRAF